MKNHNRPPLTGGLNVKFKQPVTDGEQNLGILLIQNAYLHPEIVTQKQMLRCSEIGMPGYIACQFLDCDADEECVSIPPKRFIDIIERLLHAELVLTITHPDGTSEVYTTDYLPITLIDMADDPAVIFNSPPQCFFEETEVNGKPVRQIRPNDELRQIMIDHAKKAGML